MGRFVIFWLLAWWVPGCAAPRAARSRSTGPASLVLVHTADLHSHLFPEPVLIGSADAARGLGVSGQVSAVGGFARIAGIVNAMRAGAEHSLYLDSGDLIEGTATYTEFGGEAELRAFSALGLGAAALGNHDLDPGAEDFALKHAQFAEFPVLASNFAQNGSELASAFLPSVLLDAQGLRVGVIGVANPNSPSGLGREDNPYGVSLIPTAKAVQNEIDRLRTTADFIVAISHLGLEGDDALIRGTSGLDVVLGGHQHLTLDAALERQDCGPTLQAERGCEPHPVAVVHSGALGRYVGEVDLSLVPSDPEAFGVQPRFVVESAVHSLIPVSADTPEDPTIAALLEPYRAVLHDRGFDAKLAYALGPVQRYGPNGGDSALGDLIADVVRSSTGSDFALFNTTGIRADLPPGELSRSAFVAALPFSDALVELRLSGAQLRLLLNQQARVASSRGCESPIQISGLSIEFKCSGTGSSAVARRITRDGSVTDLDSSASYTMVTSEYLAEGGSGFDLLMQATSRRSLDSDPLDLLLEAVSHFASCAQSQLPCLAPARLRDGRIAAHPS
ncbi:MAG: bifunctional UDP-sugar hydrolase/5'-nucleotidase [Polyangiaceae bacterium]